MLKGSEHVLMIQLKRKAILKEVYANSFSECACPDVDGTLLLFYTILLQMGFEPNTILSIHIDFKAKGQRRILRIYIHKHTTTTQVANLNTGQRL